jgi:hypothetical protein
MKKFTTIAIVMIIFTIATAVIAPAQDASRYDPKEVRFALSRLPGDCKEDLMISQNALALISMIRDPNKLYLEYDVLQNRQITGDDMRFYRPEGIGQVGNYVQALSTNMFTSLGFMRRRGGDFVRGGLVIEADSVLGVISQVAMRNITEEGMISFHAKTTDGKYTYGRYILFSIDKEVIAECIRQELTDIIKDETPTPDVVDLQKEIERIRSLLDQNPIIQNS